MCSPLRMFLPSAVVALCVFEMSGCVNLDSPEFQAKFGAAIAAAIILPPTSITNTTHEPVEVWIHFGVPTADGTGGADLATDGPWRLETGYTFVVPFTTYLDSVKAQHAMEGTSDLGDIQVDWCVARVGTAEAQGRWFRGHRLFAENGFQTIAEVRTDESGLFVYLPGPDGVPGDAAKVMPDDLYPERPDAPTFAAMEEWQACQDPEWPMLASPVVYYTR